MRGLVERILLWTIVRRGKQRIWLGVGLKMTARDIASGVVL